MKKPILILLAIMIILVGSILANAQKEAKVETKNSWFDSFIEFFKSFFAKFLNLEDKTLVNASEGGREYTEGIQKEEPKIEIKDITNTTEEKQENVEEFQDQFDRYRNCNSNQDCVIASLSCTNTSNRKVAINVQYDDNILQDQITKCPTCARIDKAFGDTIYECVAIYTEGAVCKNKKCYIKGEEPTIQISNISNITCGNCQYLSDNNCLNYACCNNEQCNNNEYCSEHQCKSLKCADCRYIINHTCHVYECCREEDCKVEYKCEEHKCVKDDCFIMENKTLNDNKSIPFETISINNISGGGFNSGLIFKPREDLGYTLIKNKDEWEEIKNAASINLNFSDFSNFFLILIYIEDSSCSPIYPEIDNITQNKNKILVHFTRKGQCRDIAGDQGWDIVKVNRSYLYPREYLYFYFVEGSQSSTSKSEAIHLNIAPPKGYYPSCPYYKICREEPCCDYYYCIPKTDYSCYRVFSCNGISGV